MLKHSATVHAHHPFLRSFVNRERLHRDSASKAWADRDRRFDVFPTAALLKADHAIDEHSHGAWVDLPGNLMPSVDLYKTFVFGIPPSSRPGVVDLQTANRALPVEDDFADMPVEPKVGRVSLGYCSDCERRPEQFRRKCDGII